MNKLLSQSLIIVFILFWSACKPKHEDPNLGVKKIVWPVFMRQHDMLFDSLPTKWQEAPHFGNAMIGSMLYQADSAIRLQVFRADTITMIL